MTRAQVTGPNSSNEPPVDDVLLEGHLSVTRELVAFLSPENKYKIGGDPSKGINPIRVSQCSFGKSKKKKKTLKLKQNIIFYF